MGHKFQLLVDAPSLVHIDCMGTLIKAQDVCLKKKSEIDPPLLRAYINTKKREIVCQMGTSAVLSMGCEGREERKKCTNAKGYCQELQEMFAHQLEVVHVSGHGQGNVRGKFQDSPSSVTCFFSQNSGEKLIDDPINL